MDCMQCKNDNERSESEAVSIPQAVWIACNKSSEQYVSAPQVSIPQAVWIACNIGEDIVVADVLRFQYRKRYGLHAISWELFI